MEVLARCDLPDDTEALKDLVINQHESLTAALVEAHTLIAKYEEERRLERARRFGASSEAGDYQANLFDEAEQTGEDQTAGQTLELDTVEVAAHNKRRPKRKPLPADLPSVDVYHDLADRACTC